MGERFKGLGFMYRHWFMIFLMAFLLIGCSTLGENSLKNSVALSLSSGYLHFVDIRRDQNSLYVSGKVNKPLGKDLSRAKILASFLDQEGNVITQVEEEVIPRRTRLHRGRDGRFFIKIPYDSAIKSCELGIEWH